MTNEMFILGPVLSFRGADANTWRVTALIGIAADSPIPALQVDGRACEAPVVLHVHKQQKFLRYDLSCELKQRERKVNFGIPDSILRWQFTIPGKALDTRMAYVSCNGFSDPSGMRKLVRPANSVWEDLLCNHDRNLRPKTNFQLDKEQLWHETRIHDKGLQRFHLLLMGGDQIYLDSIWEEIGELKEWVGLSRKDQLNFTVSKELEEAIESYYFELYPKRWLPASRPGWGNKSSRDCADAMARIPTIMMWDDHDIFDGWGSYSCEMQQCELFKILFHYARKSFWLFQMQHALTNLPKLESIARKNVSLQDPVYTSINWSTLKNKDPLLLPLLDRQPGFSSAFQIGPTLIVAADLRTERSRTQVMGGDTWAALKTWLFKEERNTADHLFFLSSVPVIHPKLSFIEGMLDSFGSDHVVDSNADDLKDHWAHDDHEGERKRLLETLIDAARQNRLRASIISGDVHVAALGIAYRRDIHPKCGWESIHQFTSSAIVHPSLGGVLERLFVATLNNAASKAQSLDAQHNVEMMLFPGYSKYVLPARNWLALELEPLEQTNSGKNLWASWRCETEKGFSNHLLAIKGVAGI